jgi:hypothetical protein
MTMSMNSLRVYGLATARSGSVALLLVFMKRKGTSFAPQQNAQSQCLGQKSFYANRDCRYVNAMSMVHLNTAHRQDENTHMLSLSPLGETEPMHRYGTTASTHLQAHTHWREYCNLLYQCLTALFIHSAIFQCCIVDRPAPKGHCQ